MERNVVMSESIASRLGIQSYCFRGFAEADKLIEALKACSVDRIELCGVHWQLAENPDPAPVVKTYADAGVAISAFGVHGFTEDEDAARPVFEMAKLAGFPTISADFRPGGLAVAERLCEEYGKKVALHNHGRKHALGSVAAMERLFGESSPNVGLCLDTAWVLDSGEDPLAVAEKFKDRLYGLHVKDFVFDRAGKPEDVVVGTGNLDLPGMAALLTDMDFDGYLTLEYEGDVDNPTPAVKECVDAIREAFAAV